MRNYQTMETTRDNNPGVAWNDMDVEAGSSNAGQSVSELRQTQQILIEGKYFFFISVCWLILLICFILQNKIVVLKHYQM